MERPRAIRVMLLSDIRLFRDGLHDMLQRDGRLEVVAAAATLPHALALARATEPDVVLFDMGLAESRASIHAVLRVAPGTKVISLGVAETASDVIACAEAGASGYVSRESTVEDLVCSVLNAVDQRLDCPAEIAGALLSKVASLAARRGETVEVYLTPRESDVAHALDQGLTNKQIARRLGVETATVKTHVHNILDKVGARSRGEATARLRRLGLLQPPRLASAPGVRTEPTAMS